MGTKWWDKNWELLNGCSEVSPACANCFARNYIRRFESKQEKWQGLLNDGGNWNGTVKLCPENLDLPLRTKKPAVWFVTERGDLFHEKVPEEFRMHAYDVMLETRHRHTFLILTKRPERMVKVGIACGNHIWHGTTVENQEQADKRIPELLKVPGKRFLSVEPLLSPLDISVTTYFDDPSAGIHAVIVGGESGIGARPMNPAWVRSLARQCWYSGIAFTFKQWGEWAPKSQGYKATRDVRWGTITDSGEFFESTTPWNGHDDDNTGEAIMIRVGKKKAGHLLDGKEYINLPWRTP